MNLTFILTKELDTSIRVRGSCYRNNLENFMHNFFYCETANIKDMEIHNYIISKTFFRNLQNEKELIIAAAPVTNGDVLVPGSYDRDGSRYFHINELQEKDTIKENVKSAVGNAVAQKVNILLFPEKLGSEEMIKDIPSDAILGTVQLWSCGLVYGKDQK